ncbi:TetR family transcriptional regulator [Pseudonocardia sp. N23]|uniref:TetR family transcriptional regulator n=1 Tax=Pseudonocardia sp. N23 TaxID=1987376 RepID=UPI000BFDEDA4|nr:TetR family transcriptional regulator [Pseudonocardia sp. N23]GAY09610.1 transcriptional regulator, tetr family [Pseudonocardia sp. N23]
MTRPSRAEMQRRNRARVLDAARAEFGDKGFRDAKIDAIAAAADLTRGAVYSNFPSKRALYLAVLAADAAAVPEPDTAAATPATAAQALGALARGWLGRLPLTVDEHRGAVRLAAGLEQEIAADATLRTPFAQLQALSAVVVGFALEQTLRRREDRRMVRVAETALTLLQGAARLATAAPGFGEPFTLVRACEHLADADLGDVWAEPPYVAYAPTPRPVDEVWQPPPAVDALRGTDVTFSGDGLVLVLGLHRLEAFEHVVRAAPAGTEITAALVTADPHEAGMLARLVVTELATALRPTFPTLLPPGLRLVLDDGTLAAAAGVASVSDTTEAGVRLAGGRVVARVDGWGAAHSLGAAR